MHHDEKEAFSVLPVTVVKQRNNAVILTKKLLMSSRLIIFWLMSVSL